MSVNFGFRPIGDGHPCLIVAEVGQNHNGDIDHALKLIAAAQRSGADAVKFQAGDPELYVNRAEWEKPRALQDGRVVPYIEYRKGLELSDADFATIDERCKRLGIPWFVSPLDAPSVERFARYDLPALKVASPMLTDRDLLEAVRDTGRTVILSSGMSTHPEIQRALDIVGTDRTVLMHCTSRYPCPIDHLNLRVIPHLMATYPVPIGYSGHEVGVSPSVWAVALGACVVERHFTLDRTSYGSDQAASLEPHGFAQMVREIRDAETARGDGVKQVYPEERVNMAKFRRIAA